MAAEDAMSAGLDVAARAAYGAERAAELEGHLRDVAHWMSLVEQQPLDLLDEEPDADGR